MTSDYLEAEQVYEHGPKKLRRLLIAWTVADGIELFRADLPCLQWIAMQPAPLGLSILNQQDMGGLTGVLEDELVKKIISDKVNKTIEMPSELTNKAA